MCHTSHQSLFHLPWVGESPPLVSREKEKQQEKRPSYLICERALPVIYQLEEMSFREPSHYVRWSSGTTQEWLTAMEASCLGMSSVVTVHSLKMFTAQNFSNSGLPHTFYSHMHLPLTWVWPVSVICTYASEREGRGVAVKLGDGGRWGRVHDKSRQEHTRMREQCHRSPLLCHSGAFNEKI